MDGAPGCASCPRQPHECVRTLQARSHRRGTYHPALHGEAVGGVAGGKVGAGGVVARVLESLHRRWILTLREHQVPRMEADVSPSRDRGVEPGEHAGAVFMARPASCGACDFVAGEDGVVTRTSRSVVNSGSLVVGEHIVVAQSQSFVGAGISIVALIPRVALNRGQDFETRNLNSELL